MRQWKVDFFMPEAINGSEGCWGIIACIVLSFFNSLCAQDSPDSQFPMPRNRGIAILHPQDGPYPGIGVGQVLIAAGQIAPDATVRVVAKEKSQRIFYPAIEILSMEPEPQDA